MYAQGTVIARHKTAIRRRDFSRPVKCALRDGLIDSGAGVFDYGCGHGEDVKLLRAQSVTCDGWDPVFRPDTPLTEADIVNIGYVINVIEDPTERSAALRQAWQLCQRVLVVAAQLKVAGRGKTFVEFGDGIVTGRGTFQKLYEQAELKQYLEGELGTEPIAAGLGVFYLFKDEAARQQLLASRYHRRAIAPRQRVSEALFEKHRELLERFMAAIAELGRVPEVDEFADSSELVNHFGSAKRAFAVVRRVTGADEWDTIGRRRTEDLLIYLALARFRSRPPISKLPVAMPTIPLQVRTVAYRSDQQVLVEARRVYARTHFISQNGAEVYFRSIVDSGAPLSVLPYSLWHQQSLRWTRLGGATLTRVGLPATEQLVWQGTPCELGETTVFLLDLASGVQTGPHRVVGKFVQQPVSGESETTALLGLNFLVDNAIRHALEGTGSSLSASLVVP